MMTIEWAKVLLAWPPVILILSIAAMILFRDPIKKFINRIHHVSYPGGEIGATQQANLSAEISLVAVEEKTQISALMPENSVVDNKADQTAARLWEYRYLNYFLVLHTQKVFEWIAATSNSTTTIVAYDAVWTPIINQSSERTAVLLALERHSLINIKDGTIWLTPKGKEFLTWPERKAFLPQPS